MVRGTRLVAAHLLGPQGEVLASHNPMAGPEENGVPASAVLEGLREFLQVLAPGDEANTTMALDHEEGRVLVLRGRTSALVVLLEGREDAAQRRLLGDLLVRFEERHGPWGAEDDTDAVQTAAESLLTLLEPALRVF